MTAIFFAVFVAACTVALAWVDGRRVALRDAEIARLDAAREDDADEAATTYNAMTAEIEALRCGNLGPFFGGRLSPERAAAFRLHLVTCAACEAGLLDLMQLEASSIDAKPGPTRER